MSIRALLRREHGIAVPTALLTMVAAVGFASAAVVASVHSQHQTVRDTRYKAALAAADAGAQQALLRQNKIVTTDLLRCVLSDPLDGLLPGLPLGDGWCPAVNGTVGGASYSYRVKPWTLETVLSQQKRRTKIVSTGTSGDVSRRVAVTAEATIGLDIFGAEGAIGKDSVTLSGNARTNVGTGTNGGITASGNATICGDARHGPGHTITYTGNANQCNGYGVSEGLISLPIPDQTEALASSSTSRFFTLDPKSGSVTWNSSTRALSMSGNSTLTVGGSKYSLCTLSMSGNSQLIMAAGARTHFYFDTPENCGLSGGANQISISGNAKVVSTSYNPSIGNYDLPGFYLVGSDSLATSASISGNGATDEFVLYGPRTNVSLSGNGSMNYTGVVAGKTLTMSGNATLNADPGMPIPDVNVILVFQRSRYVECTGGTGAPPDANC